mgnify:CR=1 FL=1
MSHISDDIKKEEVEVLFNTIDTDRSNSVSYYEFNSYMKKLKHSRKQEKITIVSPELDVDLNDLRITCMTYPHA